MIHVKFDPLKLPPDLQAEWIQLQVNVDKAIQENIAAWELWKQLQSYEELLKKPARNKAEESIFDGLGNALQSYLLPTGEVDPQYRVTKPDFNFKRRQTVWAEIKKFLLEHVFHQKCAYCETQTEQFYYEAEHYRPKGEVTIDIDAALPLRHVLTEDEHGAQIQHPGYFWLAFDWMNLVPSCKSCNGPGGKMSQFPVQKNHILLKRLKPEEVAALNPPPYPSQAWPGMYYLRTEQLDKLEEPLLLHPYMDKDNDPRKHIRFNFKGIEYAFNNSTKGHQSIKVFRLSKDTLRRKRADAQRKASNLFFGAYKQYVEVELMSPEEGWNKARSKICEFEEGKEQFCAAALDFLEDFSKPLRTTFDPPSSSS
jgi:hypothetical protein